MISELNVRFSPLLTKTLQQILLLLRIKVTGIVSSTHIPDLISMYGDDMAKIASINPELHCWTIKWRQQKDQAESLDTPYEVLKSVDGVIFPNIKQLMMIACTLSVTSVECERSISRSPKLND